ncbi:hypothetical protein BJ546DRAFT_845710 [Cryomyces antarcticus]
MEDALSALEREVTRIATSPYAVSLKNLHDITSRADACDIRSWAESHPSQIPVLASAVRDALQSWPYTLQILQKLCVSRDFRDEILLGEPALLDQILSKATVSVDGFEQYAGVCVSVLSEPLPEQLALPASGQTFFVHAFEKAAQSPSAATIERVYIMLDGACRGLPAILSRENLTRFEDHLFRILKTVNTVEDQSLSLLCLGIMTKMACATTSRASIARARWRSEAAQQFFTGAKAPKTMQLIVLRVIWACKGNVGIQHSEAYTSVRLGNEILKAVDTDLRNDWIRRNTPIVRKLHEKVLTSDARPELQLEALTFLGILAEVDSLPRQSISMYKALLLQSAKLPTNRRLLQRTLRASLQRFAVILLHHYLRITVEPWSQPSLAMRGLRLSILELVTLAREFSSVRRGVLLALSSNETSPLLEQFLRISVNANLESRCETSEACSTAFEAERWELGLAICSLLLKAALSAQSDEVGITTAVANALLDKQAAFAAAISRCQSLRSTSLNVPTIAKPLPNEKVMQQEQHYGRDWRQQLAADLRREARDREGTIIQTVGRICHDLEERCEKAEEPLREEQAKVRSLQERHDQLSLVVSKLETEAMDRSLYVDAIEVENTRQERDLQQSALKMTETLRKVGDLQGQLRETNASHERSLAELRYTNESRELEFAATLATKTDHISDQEEKVRDMEQSLRKLKDDLEETDRDRSRLKDSNTNLRNTVESMQQELESRRLSSTELQSDIERLTKAEEGLTSQMRGLQNSLQEKHVELERMQSEIHNLRGSSESAIEALKAQHLSELDGIVDTVRFVFNAPIPVSMADQGHRIRLLRLNLKRSYSK